MHGTRIKTFQGNNKFSIRKYCLQLNKTNTHITTTIPVTKLKTSDEVRTTQQKLVMKLLELKIKKIPRNNVLMVRHILLLSCTLTRSGLRISFLLFYIKIDKEET